MLMTNEARQAAAIIQRYQDEMISVIVRHGDIRNDQSFSAAPGDRRSLCAFRNGDVMATVTAVNPKPYAEVLRTEWIKAGCRIGDEFERRQEMDPDLKGTDMATVIEFDLNSLRYEPR